MPEQKQQQQRLADDVLCRPTHQMAALHCPAWI